ASVCVLELSLSEYQRRVARRSLILSFTRQLEDFLLPSFASPRQSSLSERYGE
ncbi:hypothetical protein A2U01_0097952, partial [Trifolium medium]|nr:hypothetical protein [Trifolium medium]